MADLYVLAPERSKKVVQDFLFRWANGFEECADEYEFPQYSESPEKVYRSPLDLIERLISDRKAPHSIYWRNPRKELISMAMLFFTTDGFMIAGVTAETEDDAELRQLLESLASSLNSSYGIAFFEEPPPSSGLEFIAAVQAATELRVIKEERA